MSRFKIHAEMYQGLGQRTMQQDAMDISPEEVVDERGMLAVLSDGIGGMEAGERFSAMAVHHMMDRFVNGQTGDDLCERLLDAYQYAREKALALRSEEGIEGGATVVAVLIQKGNCAFLSAGDSRIYLLRKGGIIQLNREHTLGHYLDELAALSKISRKEAEDNIHRKAIVNNIAEESALPCDLCARPFPLCTGDRLALLSDGVFNTLTEKEIAHCLERPEGDGAHYLIEAVREYDLPGQDNYSAVVLEVCDAAG